MSNKVTLKGLTAFKEKLDDKFSLKGHRHSDYITRDEMESAFLTTEGGTISGDIVPETSGTISLGSEENKLKAIYADEIHISENTLYVGETPVLGTDVDTIIVKADRDQAILVKTTGQGATQVSSESSVQLNATGQGSTVSINSSGTNGNIAITAQNALTISAQNTTISGNTTIENLNVTGTTTTVNSANLDVKDNIITVNKGETGSTVSAGQAGLKVDRGGGAAYFIMFDESDDMFKVGMQNDLETIASQDYVDTEVAKKYAKPSTGIPKSDLASAVQTSLGKADTALQSFTETDPVFAASVAAGITEADIINWNGKTSTNGTYSMPNGGIPASDLTQAVQTSLGLADTALQSYTETDPVFSASAASGITATDISNWNAKYVKASDGIPKTDLESAVQTSLGLADTALQSYTETDPVFVASAAHDITSTDITNWNAKADTTGATFTGNVTIGGTTINASNGHIITATGLEIY